MAELDDGALLDGKYRLAEVIGRGGMATVYAAEDLRFSREVAIKVLNAGASQALAERLFREARAAARANHPAVITMFAYGSDPELGVDYVVMERLCGEDLASRLRRAGPLSPGFVLRVASEVADALAAAHAAHVIHRDLKPSNVFLAQRGLRVDEVKLLDFGVAKHLDLHTLTRTGEVVGSLAYMAPEQILDPRSVGVTSDVYALGVIMYECLTNELPFTGRTLIELTQRIVQSERVSLASLRPELPLQLSTLVEDCLAREPAARPRDARGLCSALLELAAFIRD